MRAFDETITWLRFRLDLRQAPPSFWLLLGDCAAGMKQIQQVPMPAPEGRSLELEVLASGLHGRLAMDGSPMTVEQVIAHLQRTLRMPPAEESLQLEVDGLWYTWQRMMAEGPASALNSETIRAYHRSILEGVTELRDRGKWRIGPIGTTPVDGVPPELISVFMDELCDWVQGPDLQAGSTHEQPAFALLQALITELYLHWIHPFQEGHYRLAGTVMNHLLHPYGVGTTVGHLLAAQFNRHRQEYLRHVAQAAYGVSDPIPFIAFGLQCASEGLSGLHERIRSVQTDALWKAHGQDLFGEADHAPERRRRQVLNDIAEHQAAVPLSGIPELSPALAKMYAGVSEKTLRRDVDALESLGALVRTPSGLRVRRERLLAFGR